jgi:hypothetical protein
MAQGCCGRLEKWISGRLVGFEFVAPVDSAAKIVELTLSIEWSEGSLVEWSLPLC